MFSFFGSRDLRYFASKSYEELTLARNDKVLWKKKMPDDEFQIIGVGNNGITALRCKDGIWIYGLSEIERGEFVEAFSKKTLAQKFSRIERAFLKDTGTQICLDIVYDKGKAPDKRFSKLSQAKAKKDQEYHEILFYSIQGKNHERFHRFEQSRESENRVCWNISSDFEFMVIGEPQRARGGTKIKFSVVHTPSCEAYNEFSIKEASVSKLLINDQGSVLLDIYSGSLRELFIINDHGERSDITPPPDFEVMHLGKNFIALLLKPEPSLLIKTFEDVVRCHADLRPLNEQNIPFSLVFDSKDNINIVYMFDDELKSLLSDIDRIQVDAKRWDLLRKQATYSPQTAIMEVREREEKKIPIELTLKKEEEQRVKTLTSKEDVIKAVENLRIEFIMGQIGDDEYKKAKEKLQRDLLHMESLELSEKLKETPPSFEEKHPPVRKPLSSAPDEWEAIIKGSFREGSETGEVPGEREAPSLPKESSFPLSAEAKGQAGDRAPMAEVLEPAVEPAPMAEVPEPAVEPAPMAEVPEPPVEPAPMAEVMEPAVEPAPMAEVMEPVQEPSVKEVLAPSIEEAIAPADELQEAEEAPPLQQDTVSAGCLEKLGMASIDAEYMAPVQPAEVIASLQELSQMEPPEFLEERVVTFEESAPVAKVSSIESPEKEKLRKLLEVLDEHLIVGLISEKTYNNLRNVYTRTLGAYDIP